MPISPVSRLGTYGGPIGIGGPWSRPLVKQCVWPQAFASAVAFQQTFAQKLVWPQTFNLIVDVSSEI